MLGCGDAPRSVGEGQKDPFQVDPPVPGEFCLVGIVSAQ